MKYEDNFLASFGKSFVFKKLRPRLRMYLLKAGYNNVPYTFYGGLFFATMLVAMFPFFYFVVNNTQNVNNFLLELTIDFFGFALIGLIMVAVVILSLYLYYDIKIFQRTAKMESHLADYLQLVSSNLKGGMSFEKSLWAAISPQFSILSNEISLASKKVITGHDVDVALQEFSDKYDSPILKRTMGLIIGEIRSGGKIAELIDRIIQDLRETKELKEDMRASVVSYMIFIGAVVVVISPALFALSYNLLIIITGFAAKLAASSAGGAGAVSILPSSMGSAEVDVNGFKLFSMFAIGLTSLYSSMIISILEKGNIKGGIKYIPLFIIISIILYNLLLNALVGIFGGIIV